MTVRAATIGALLLSAAAAYGQSVAGEVNRELPPWLRIGGEYRMRLESFDGIGFRDRTDTHVLNRVRLNLKIQPVTWLKFVAQGQDARVWGNNPALVPSAPPYKDAMDLRMAYLELGDPEARPLGLRVGRQELAFGEQRLVGHTSWSNTARTFDAVRATLNYRGWRFDAFASSVVNVRNGEFNRRTDGNNLHGLYVSTGALVPKSTSEAYLLWRVAPLTDFHTAGTRWAGKLPANFDYGIEMAAQTGTSLGSDMRTWAGHWLLGHTVASAAWKPRLIAEYNYATGDEDPGDRKRGTFDTLYPTPHDKYGLTDQVGWRNIHHARGALEMKPHPQWTVIANYHHWWRASARDGLYNAAGSLIVAPGTATAKHVGQELNIQAVWAATKQIQAGGGVGHLFAGEFLKQATAGHGYTYPYLMLTYTF